MRKELWDRQGKTLRITRRKCIAKRCSDVPKRKKKMKYLPAKRFFMLFPIFYFVNDMLCYFHSRRDNIRVNAKGHG